MNQFEFFHKLGVKYPVIGGGMAFVSDSSLTAAVSDAGGLGILASATMSLETARNEIKRVKELTSKPFGVNVMLLSKNAPAMAELICEEGVKVVTTGAGNPSKYLDMWKKHNITVIPVVPSATIARKMEDAGVDAVVAEGAEAGGHIGKINTMALIPQAVDAVKIPVIAAGGIGDGRGVAAAFMLGASGVQLGTRFLVAKECTIHHNYKQAVIDAKDTDSAVTGMSSGHPVRVLKNKLTAQLEEAEKKGASPQELAAISAGAFQKAAEDGDAEFGSIVAGQVAGLVTKEQSCKEMIVEIFAEAQARLSGFDITKIIQG